MHWSRFYPLAVPYVAVILGLHVLHSAWMGILLYHLGMVMVLVIAGRRRPPVVVAPGWHQHWRFGWRPGVGLTAIGVAALAGPLLLLLWPIIRLPDPGLAVILESLGLRGVSWLLFAVYFCTIHPVLEELYWRGHLASRQVTPVPADLAFGGYHAVVLLLFVEPLWALVTFLVLAAAAWGWRQLVRLNGGMLVPILAHLVGDVSIIAAAWSLLS